MHRTILSAAVLLLASSSAALAQDSLATAYYNRGRAWVNRDEYDKAIADYNEAVRLDPKYANAYNSRAAGFLFHTNDLRPMKHALSARKVSRFGMAEIGPNGTRRIWPNL